MQEQNKPKIYISGMIAGCELLDAKLKFFTACESLRQDGFIPINPFDISPYEPSKTWEQYMVDDIAALLKCDAIYMLKDWGMSRGARIEYAIAKELGLLIMFES